MKNKNIILGIFILFIIAACAKVDEQDRKNVGTLTLPVASFYVTGNEVPAPVTVTFNNTSEYSDQYLWTFHHNQSTSSEHSPSVTFHNNTDEDITILVTLKVTDSGTGETNTRSKSILIKHSI